MNFPIDDVRAMFPSLSVTDNGCRRVYFDNPAGTQVPLHVIDAVSDVYLRYNSNAGVFNTTSLEIDAMTARAYKSVASFLGSDDPGEVIIGPNMTSLTYQLSRALSHQFSPGDEIIVTQMDHEGNISPWLQMAEDNQLSIRWLPFNKDTWRIETDDLRSLLTERTKLLALNYASNLTGAINDAKQLTAVAKDAGALVYVDGVQFTPHEIPDVQDLGCDFFACSSYKFFGPHLGVVWGRRAVLERLHAYKARCAAECLPDRLITGTQQLELIAGLLATVEYFLSLGRMVGGKGNDRELMEAAYQASEAHEQTLSKILLEQLTRIKGIHLHGPNFTNQSGGRVPTFSFTHPRFRPIQIAKALSAQGIFCHWGHNYALEASVSLNMPRHEGAVRIGLAHYNTEHEVNEMLTCLSTIVE